jgi:hypothetical protein
MKLIVRQLSGLGNQLFQYAAGLYYSGLLNAELSIVTDPSQNAISHGHPRPFLLSHFAVTAKWREMTAAERVMFFLESRGLNPASRRALKRHVLLRWQHIQLLTEDVEQRFRFQTKLPVDVGAHTVYLFGYWQVHNIAEKISERLRHEFALRDQPTGQTLEVLRSIRNTENSVSLHIRRGDYTLASEGNVALPFKYYSNAMHYMKQRLTNPTFFVFSDDIKFAKENIDKNSPAVFVEHNDSLSAHEDLRLMSNCKHHIIANSTFSWWGAWLGTSKSKIVLAPRKWLVANCPTENDLIPSTWRLLDGT